MDFLDMLRTMARRWYVVVPVLLLTAAGVYWMAITTEPTYEANGMFIMTQPGSVPGELADGSVVIPGPEGSITSVPALVALLSSDAVRAELTGGSSATYEVSSLSGAEFLDVRVRGPERDEVAPLLARVLEEIDRQVGEVVQVVPPPSAARELPPGPDGTSWFAASAVVSTPTLVGSTENAPAASFNGRLLSEMMADPAARREVLGDQLGKFEFSQDRRNPGPFLELTVTSTSPEGTLELFDRAVSEASERLDALQSTQGAASRMVLQPLRRPAGAELVSGALSRPLFTVAGLGGLAALGLALLVEALAGRRDREEGSATWSTSTEERSGPAGSDEPPAPQPSAPAVAGQSHDRPAPAPAPPAPRAPATSREEESQPDAEGPDRPRTEDASPDDASPAEGRSAPASTSPEERPSPGADRGERWFDRSPALVPSAPERPGDASGSTG